jgi:hypothetical protein
METERAGGSSCIHLFPPIRRSGLGDLNEKTKPAPHQDAAFFLVDDADPTETNETGPKVPDDPISVYAARGPWTEELIRIPWKIPLLFI